ncbi:MAG: UvrD-helicase domain-containing protein [Candidatus Sumerlaeia bacterium]|nr:UvrD-helicase domain-containing protein [Candidatus Sumerlaeia bacterium]
MKFTPSQQAAIDITGRNLVVSAGAGSGKTATLIERIYRLVTDPGEPRRIDQLLVVTFTRAAAGEMKERLVARFREALADDGLSGDMRTHIEEQLYNLPSASISTIHSFCLDLISSFPNLAGLAPGFELMAVEEARLLRRDFLVDKIAESLNEDNETARCLRRILDVRDPLSGMDTLVKQLSKIHEFLDALVDHEGLLARQEQLADPANPATNRLLSDYLEAMLQQVRGRIAPLLAFDPGSLNEKFREQLEHLRALDGQLAGPIPVERIPSLLELLSLPALSRKKMEESDADLQFKEIRTEVMGVLRDIRKELAVLVPEELPTLLQLSSDLSLELLRGPGIAWNREHFELHMSMRKLTFSHLEKISHRLLHDIPESERIRAWYRERFTDVLVDEFQDVNELQDAIIRAISRDGGDGLGGNRFFVGDVKQSIYQFRQADPTLFLRLLDDAFPHGGDDLLPLDTRIDLVENFRSSPRLLGEMNQLFERILLRETAGVDYRDGHAFIPGRKDIHPEREPSFSLHLVDKKVSGDWEDEQDTLAEAALVANRISELGPPWRDHTILLRSTRGTAPALIEALATQGIPVYCEARIGFLAAVEVIEFQSILRAISNPFHDMSFLGMLRGPAFRWSDDDLLALRMISRELLYIQLVEAAAGDGDHPLSERSRQVLETLARWQEWATRQSMADFFAQLMDDIDLLDAASTRPGGDQRRLNLEFLLERGRQFDRFSRKGLDEFLRFLDDLIENGEDFAPPSPLSDDADVVRIMTIHASKGMQFPLVYIPFLGKRFNEEDLRSPFLHDREIGLASSVTDIQMPEETTPLLHRLFRNHLRKKLIAEELRLLYVALTRAREGVMVTGTTGGLEKLNAQPRSGMISPARIHSAGNALDWLVAHGALRFPDADFMRSGTIAADGIASLVVHRGEQLASLQPDFLGDGTNEDQPPLSTEFLTKFHAAATRIDALHALGTPDALRAKVSVTELKRTYDASRDLETPPYHAALDEEGTERELELPPILRGEKRATGAQRGQAVHRFLANCDLLAIGRGERRLTEERDRLVAEEVLTTEEARLVSLPGIQWFFNSKLGKEVLGHGAEVERERSFIVRIDAREIDQARDGEDIVILQGVADLLYRTSAGWVLIDFKTDYCGEAGEKVAALAKGYTPQLWLYRLAIERALGGTIAASWLVFLHGRENWLVEEAENQEAAWQEIVRAGAIER